MCECKLILFSAFVLYNVFSVTSYNIDTSNYAVYRGQSDSMFGFTVGMHKDRGDRGWVLVGAPEALSQFQDGQQGMIRGGAVYRCRTDADDTCEEIPFHNQSSASFNRIADALDDRNGQWFGATLSTSGRNDGPVVACAPRYIWFTKDLNRRDPVGTCFRSNGAFNDFEEYSPCRTTQWGYHRQGSCQAGFSAGINRDGDRLFIGAPGSYYWQGQMYSIDANARFNYTPSLFGNVEFGAKGSVFQQSLENRPAVFSTREGSSIDDDSYIGYSTVVGHFLQGEEYEGIAVGMPRGNDLKGKVLLFTWTLRNYKNITVSTQIGSYFGYSITAADVNGDKKLDLIVGAPMHTEPNNDMKYDVGRVYILYQSSNFEASFNSSDFIDGTNSKSRFGHAVAFMGDLNQDGFDDFAVGAPYDGPNERGAVYIYYGSKAGVRTKYGQVIFAEEIQTRVDFPVSTFGFSLAGALDLDSNEYPDMAVGSYLSNTAFFLRAQPVAFIDASVRFLTAEKQVDIKNSNCVLPNGQNATCTAVRFCLQYSGKGIPSQLFLNVQYVLDSKKSHEPRMMFRGRGTHTFNDTIYYDNNRNNCTTYPIYIKSDIRDKLTPLEVEVNYSLMRDERSYSQTRHPLSQLTPVLDLNIPASRQDTLNIQKNCGSDNICIPNLHLNVTSNVEKYLLGSNGSLEFDVTVSNFGEDSYETTFEMEYPEGIFYNKSESKKDMPGITCSPRENRTIFCDIGNPLPMQKITSFKILFQPYYKEGMPPTYKFEARVNSSNPEESFTRKDNHVSVGVDILIDASLELRGDSYPTTVYFNESQFSATEILRESDIGPQVTHVYYVANKGPVEIQEVEVFIMWPLKTLGGEDLLYLLEQPHTKGNVKCDAVEANYKHYALDYVQQPIWDRLKIDVSGTEVSGFSVSKTEERIKTTETGGGLISGVGVVNKEVPKKSEAGFTTGDSSLITSSRSNQSSASNSFGTINTAGESVSIEAKKKTVWIQGVPHVTWHNVTTVRDANGKILRRFNSSDSSSGDYSTVTEGLISLPTDLSHSRTEYQNKQSGSKIRYENRNQQSGSNIAGEIRHQTPDREDVRRFEERRRQQEEARRKEEERRQLEEIRQQTLIREQEERRRQELIRREEEKKREEEKRKEDERRREVERLRQEQWQLSERRRLEEERRRQQQHSGGAVDSRYEQERRYQDSRTSGQESRPNIRTEEERRRYYEEARRRLEVEEARRRQEAEEARRRQQVEAASRQNFRTEEERRRYYEEVRRREEARNRQSGQSGTTESRNYEEDAYEVGGGSREGGFQHAVYGLSRNPSGGEYNRTYVVESSTTIPIEIGGSQSGQRGFGEAASGGGFTVQTWDLGNAGSEGGISGSASGRSQSEGSANAYGQSGGAYGQSSGRSGGSSGGDYRTEWHREGSYSRSGQIPPTFLHNSIESDNAPSSVPDTNSRRRGKRDIYDNEEIRSLIKCNSTDCRYIRCVVGALDTDKEIIIALRSRLNVRAIKDITTTNQSLKLSSMMVGKISKLPYVSVLKEQIFKKHEIFTEVPAKETELVSEVPPLWIYIVSAVAGVIMLLLLIWILSKFGFFKRHRPSTSAERQPLNRNGYHSGDEAL